MATPVRLETTSIRDQVEQVQHDLGLSDGELAAVLVVPPDTLRDDRLEAAVKKQPTRHRFQQLADLHGRLHETFAPDGVPKWLRNDNRYLGGQKPIEALVAGRFDRVDAALGALDWGIFI